MKKTSNKGITLISLIITVIIMAIIAGISINYGFDLIENSESNKLKSELLLVQQAVRKQYLKYDTVKDTDILKGEQINDVSSYANKLGVTLTGNYYCLNSDNLSAIGVNDAEYEYIVDYETGEVINKTKLKNDDYNNQYEVYLEGTEIDQHKNN